MLVQFIHINYYYYYYKLYNVFLSFWDEKVVELLISIMEKIRLFTIVRQSYFILL